MPSQFASQSSISPRRIAAIIVPHLVHHAEGDELDEQLLELAEVVGSFGHVVSLSAPDTVWVDVTGVGHLFVPSSAATQTKGELQHQGEEILAEELMDQVRELGHQSQVVIASGPRIAQAVARYAMLNARSIRVVPPGETASVMQDLPLLALLDIKRQIWFARLGVITVGDLLALPQRSVASRLGKDASGLLELARGRDVVPLIPCQFPREIRLTINWEEPSEGIEPLLFAVRGLVGRLCARLSGRGEAVRRLDVEIEHDRAICRHRGLQPKTLLEFELASPIHREDELKRIIKSRLERIQLPAPSIGLELCASGFCPQVQEQLELGTRSVSQRLDQLPGLIAELENDVGRDHVGILTCQDAHCPEERSRLRPLSEVMGGAHRPAQHRASRSQKHGSQKDPKHRSQKKSGASSHPKRMRTKQATQSSTAKKWAKSEVARPCPEGAGDEVAISRRERARLDPLDRATRLLKAPVLIPVPLRTGEGFALGSSYYTIERLQFAERLDLIKWWSSESQCRDYLWAWLSSSRGGIEALLYVDRRTQKAFLQALAD